jgi:rhodanese-related sulfurtransferase
MIKKLSKITPGLLILLIFAGCSTGLDYGSPAGAGAPPLIVGNDQADIRTVQNLEVDVHQAYRLREEGVFVLDVRTPEEWNQNHIPGATLIPLDELPARISELPNDQEILIYCRSGNRSLQALQILQAAGYTEIFSLQGGINDWINAGYPVE